MSKIDREIHELLVDYAAALRDGEIPLFLKSLSRQEAAKIAASPEFRHAGELARVINSAGFADKFVTPDVGLFISRVDAKIASRLRKAGAPKPRHSPHAKGMSEARRTERGL